MCTHTYNTSKAIQSTTTHMRTHNCKQHAHNSLTANKQHTTKHPAHMCKHTPTHNAKPDKTVHLLDAEAGEEVIGRGL